MKKQIHIARLAAVFAMALTSLVVLPICRAQSTPKGHSDSSQPTADSSGNASGWRSSPTPLASKKQIVLNATIIEVDRARLSALGIGLPDSVSGDPSDADVNSDNTPRRINNIVTKDEAGLLTQLLTTSRAGKVVARPTIVAMDGRPATFHSGGELPFFARDSGGGRTIEYRPIGTSIKFAPKLIPNARIRMELQVILADVDASKSVRAEGAQIPGYKSHQFETAVEMPLGKTAVLGSTKGQQILVLVTPELAAPAAAKAIDQPLSTKPSRLTSNVKEAAKPAKAKNQVKNQPAARNALASNRANGIAIRSPRPATATPRYAPQHKAPPKISLATSFYAVDSKALQSHGLQLHDVLLSKGAAMRGGSDAQGGSISSVMTPRDAAELIKLMLETNVASLISRPQMVTVSGQSVRAEVKSRVQLPSSGKAHPASAKTADVGLTLDLVPYISGGKVRLLAHAEQTRLVDKKIKGVKMHSIAEMYPGEVLAICQKANDGEQLLLLVTPNPAGHDHAWAERTPPATSEPQRPLPPAPKANLRDSQPQYGAPTSAAQALRQTQEDAEIEKREKAVQMRRLFDVTEAINRVLPDAKIKLHPLPQSVVVSGSVENEQQASVLKDVVQNYFQDVIINVVVEESNSKKASQGSEDLTAVIRELYPHAEIKINRLNSSVVLSGQVAESSIPNIVRIAEDYYPNVIVNFSNAGKAAPAIAKQSRQAAPAPPRADQVRIEMRELRRDVQDLRREVSKLIRLLEDGLLEGKPAAEQPIESTDLPTGSAPQDSTTSEESAANSESSPSAEKVESAQVAGRGVKRDRAWDVIGIRVEPTKLEGVRYRGGVKITQVRPDSPAAEQGLQIGDVLVGLANWEVLKLKDVEFALKRLAESEKDSIKFFVRRKKETLYGYFKTGSQPSPKASQNDQSKVEQSAHASPLKTWRVTLPEVIQIGLQNSKVIRSLGVTAVSDDGAKGVILRNSNGLGLTEIQESARRSVGDWETSYWMLWSTHRALDHVAAARDSALDLWTQARQRSKSGDAESQTDAAARDQYFRFRDQYAKLKSELFAREADLRWKLGVSASDGRMMRPSEEPQLAQMEAEWKRFQKAQDATSPAQREQESAVSKAEAEFNTLRKALLANAEPKAAAMFNGFSEASLDKADQWFSRSDPSLGFRKQLARLRETQLRLARARGQLMVLKKKEAATFAQSLQEVQVAFGQVKFAFEQRAACEARVRSKRNSGPAGRETADALEIQARLVQSQQNYFDRVTQFQCAIEKAFRLNARALRDLPIGNRTQDPAL